jgi:hypothetical protein
MSAGKGDKPRPINKKIFDENFDKIFKEKKLQIKSVEICTKKNKKTYLYR